MDIAILGGKERKYFKYPDTQIFVMIILPGGFDRLNQYRRLSTTAVALLRPLNGLLVDNLGMRIT